MTRTIRFTLATPCFVPMLLLLAPAASDADTRVQGYVAAGPAAVSGFFGPIAALHSAGGVEVLFGRTGMGGEVGILGNSSGVLVVVSLNGIYLPVAPRPDQRILPFVTGGYTTMGNADGSFGAFNVGGGATLRLQDRVGLRFELRNHIRPDSRGTVSYWAGRMGVSIRIR